MDSKSQPIESGLVPPPGYFDGRPTEQYTPTATAPQQYLSEPTQAYYPPAGAPGYPQQPYMQNPPAQVVTMQPFVVAAPQKPPNNMILAVIVTLFCNLCCGIAAIIFANQSDNEFNNGNVEEARRKGEIAKKISIAGMISGVLLSTGVVILYFVWYVTLYGYY